MKKTVTTAQFALAIVVLLRASAWASLMDAPEMNPGMAVAGLALLTSSLLMIFGRNKK